MLFYGISRAKTETDWTGIGGVCTKVVRADAGRTPHPSADRSQLSPLGLLLILLSGLILLVGALTPALAQPPESGVRALSGAEKRREARGWIELEQDQRAYRSKVEPLDLQQQRELEVIERSQALDLRALQQRDVRELERVERQQRLTPSSNLDRGRIQTRDAAADIRRRAERHRSNIRLQQEGLPFGR